MQIVALDGYTEARARAMKHTKENTKASLPGKPAKVVNKTILVRYLNQEAHHEIG